MPKVSYRVWTGTYYCHYSYSKIRLLHSLMNLRRKLSQEKCACVCVLRKVVVVVGQCIVTHFTNTLLSRRNTIQPLIWLNSRDTRKILVPILQKKKKKKRASYRLGVNVSASQPLQVPAFIGPWSHKRGCLIKSPFTVPGESDILAAAGSLRLSISNFQIPSSSSRTTWSKEISLVIFRPRNVKTKWIFCGLTQKPEI